MTAQPDAGSPQQTAGKLLGLAAGYVGLRTAELGLRHGLLEALAREPEGATSEDLAGHTGLDPFYVAAWCRAAYAAELLDASDGRYRLAPHVETLLLDDASPTWVGGLFRALVQPELFDRFSERFASGERLWWDQVSPEFIDTVAGTSRPFFTRLLERGIPQVPGLEETLGRGARVLDLGCGVGHGLARLVERYPSVECVGVDGDAHSLALAREHVAAAGVSDRVSLVQSTLEDYAADSEFDVALINVTMHECRDPDRVTEQAYRALKPGGMFVVSDFPFPAELDGLRTAPARVMTGIQYFEALIGDQLLPAHAYADLLRRHDFRDVATVELAPVHCLVVGKR